MYIISLETNISFEHETTILGYCLTEDAFLLYAKSLCPNIMPKYGEHGSNSIHFEYSTVPFEGSKHKAYNQLIATKHENELKPF